MPWFLGNAFIMHSMSANIARTANSGIYMHRDQMGLTPETIDHAYLLNAMWYLVDVTEPRGATRVYPGSHNKNVAPPTINDIVCNHFAHIIDILFMWNREARSPPQRQRVRFYSSIAVPGTQLGSTRLNPHGLSFCKLSVDSSYKVWRITQRALVTRSSRNCPIDSLHFWECPSQRETVSRQQLTRPTADQGRVVGS